MNNKRTTYMLLGHLTLSLALLSGASYADGVRNNNMKSTKGPKAVNQGVQNKDSGETLPYFDSLPYGRIDNYEQLLKDLNPSGAPVKTGELFRKLQDPEE